MPKASLVSIVEDDRFVRDSMRRLMKSLGHSAEAFSSAADFLASPRLVETACLVVGLPVGKECFGRGVKGKRERRGARRHGHRTRDTPLQTPPIPRQTVLS
jgi:FixJ family two-component response regulator